MYSCQSKEYVKTNLPELKIYTGRSEMMLIKRKRREALMVGLLETNGKDFVTSTMITDSQSYSALIRLKGDWLDHIRGSQWSLRIKLTEDKAYMGMKQFSLQSPATRSFLDEWLFHKLLQQEDILTPTYEFIQLWWNDEYKGVYAMEEHFDSPLLERNKRRDGPILKFEEDGFWQVQAMSKRSRKQDKWAHKNLPVFEAADIKQFGNHNESEFSTCTHCFVYGQAILDSLRFGNKGIHHMIDVDKMARFYALADLTKGYHALRWHNLRYYYNPLSGLLEPVVYDGYGDEGPYLWFSKPYLGYIDEQKKKLYFLEEFIVFKLFNDDVFSHLYYQYLKEYLTKEYIESFEDQVREELGELEQILKWHYPDATLRSVNYQDQARQVMAEYTNRFQDSSLQFEYHIYDPMYADCQLKGPLKDISVKAFFRNDLINLQNYFCKPIKIVATGPKKSKPIHKLSRPMQLPVFDINNPIPVTTIIPYHSSDRFVFYEVPGIDYWYTKKIKQEIRLSDHDYLDLENYAPDTATFQIVNDTFYLFSGKYQFNRPLIIPRGRCLYIKPGVELDLIDSAFILIQGSLIMEGDSNSGIWINSTDRTSRGIHLVNGQSALIQHSRFSHLGSLRAFGRVYSGAFTAYGTPLKMASCFFENNHSEDALNIVNGAVKLSKTQFSNINGDALDIDFSQFQLSQLDFRNISGDALDFSGSKGVIHQVRVDKVQDKALSVGEESKVEINTLWVKNSTIGVAVKDASTCHLIQPDFSDNQYDFVVFRKKSIYGSGSQLSVVADATLEQNAYNYLLEQGERLIINDKTLAPNKDKGTLNIELYK